MTAEAKQCPKCGAAQLSFGAHVYCQYACGSTLSIDRGNEFAESWLCARNQLSALTARVAELEGERERLTALLVEAVDDADYFGSQMDEYFQEKYGFKETMERYRDLLAALAPPSPQPSQEGK
jgi:hypothetical protein